MLVALFWFSAALLVYIYFGFPVLVFLRGKLFRKPYRREAIEPRVSIVIVAHNEAVGIGKKLDNLLALNYPRDKVEIIIASDGSDDGTEAIVEQYAGQGIQLLEFPRRGKIPALNQATKQAKNEILVFSDANSMYGREALRYLVQPFADPGIGGVAGNQTYLDSEKISTSSTGERTYWSYDQAMKQMQSEAGSVTSATGAIYAIRRELFDDVPLGACDDAVTSYRVISKGYRMVYEPRAVAYEPVAASAEAEFQRKFRVSLRGLRALRAEPRLFNPFKYGFYSLQLFSHKLLRRLQGWPLMGLFISALLLAPHSAFFTMVAALQMAFYGFAGLIFLARRHINAKGVFKVLTIPFYFCMVNMAFLLAQIHFVRGQKIDIWQVRRADA